MTHRKYLKHKKRIVIKVGTSLLTYDNGIINLQRMERLSMVLADLHNSGKEVVLVSSGAVGVGAGMIGLNLAKQIISTWLETDFGGGRHQRRVNKISDIEQRFSKG